MSDDATVGDFLAIVGMATVLGVSVTSGITKCVSSSIRNEVLDNAALKVDLEKTFSPNKSVF